MGSFVCSCEQEDIQCSRVGNVNGLRDACGLSTLYVIYSWCMAMLKDCHILMSDFIKWLTKMSLHFCNFVSIRNGSTYSTEKNGENYFCSKKSMSKMLM